MSNWRPAEASSFRAATAGALEDNDRQSALPKGVKRLQHAVVGRDAAFEYPVIVEVALTILEGPTNQVPEHHLRHTQRVRRDNLFPIDVIDPELADCLHERVRHYLRGIEQRSIHVPHPSRRVNSLKEEVAPLSGQGRSTGRV